MLVVNKNILAILMLSLFSYSKNNIQVNGVLISSISTEPFIESSSIKNAAVTDLKFDSFFKKFESDRNFQLSRTQFPLKVITHIEDGQSIKFLKKSEWKYTNFSKIKNIEIKKTSKAKNETDVKLSITDTGVQVVYHFKIKNGEWWLLGITDMSD